MNNLQWKKIGLIGIGLVAVAAAVFYFIPGKGAKTFNSAINPAFGEYISSYTAGVISSGSPIRVLFSKDAVDSASIGYETTVKLFEFSPAVAGTTIWHDRRTVEFKPSARLTSGQIYEVQILLSKLFQVPGNLNSFEYTFQVIPQNFEVAVENIKPYVKTQLARQKIEGTLFTADFAENEAVEKMMTAQQEDKSLKVSWTHSGEGKQHLFIVEDVSRKEAASLVKLAISGQAIGIEQSVDKQVEIPALGDFKVTNVQVEQGSSQHVVLQFSDPLSEIQNLEGLINISDMSSLDFEIKDNEVWVYPPVRQTGSRTLTVEAGIQNVLNYKMLEGSSFEVAFEQVLPAVRFTGKGTILPSSDGLVMPFEAVNLKSVDVQIIKIFENNVLQFLQVNNYHGNQELRRVGKSVLKKTMSLENAGITDLGKWNRFTLDLSMLINAEPGAIYQVRIGFKKSYLAYACEQDDETGNSNSMSGFELEDAESEGESEESYWDSYEDYYYGEDYDWEQRDNPCHSSYYTSNRTIKRNVIASDLGLIAKRGGDGNTVIIVTDLKTTEPISGVQLDLYDYRQQVIGSASTGADGKANILTRQNPFVLVAKSGSQRGYLKLEDGESLSLSNFDVGGEQVSKGLKGLLYGERGVWRPGDSLYLSFILEDKLKTLPTNHPVVFELQNPQGQITNRLVRSNSENGFYKFATATSSDAPTGNWLGRIKVGGTEFTQFLKIEMVKPNRLKINLDFGVDKLTVGNNNVSGKLKVNWLHGAPGKNLKAEFEVLLTKAETKFAKYTEFVFDDPSRNFSSESQPIFEGYTDSEGNATVNADLQVSGEAPGMLHAIFRGKVFEESGNFSIDRFSIPYYPYESFTGILLPKGDKARAMLLTDITHRVDVVTVDADGNLLPRNIEMSLYKVEWRWWWDSSEEGTVNYMSGNYSQPLAVGNIRTTNGKGAWNFKIKYPEWGRYYVKAYDPQSGHSAGKIVYIDWPGWAGRARQDGEGATMLSFASDKPTYTIGEKANLVIPGSDKGRALISIESGSRVIETYWLETQKGDNPFGFEITKEMTPNVFVHVTMLQSHAQTVNDLPIRLYGMIPIQIEDPDTHLNPVISMPEVLEPGLEVVIKVSEQNKRKMTYTLAIVEEGLLDLTRYRTPDVWSRFYAREALGVKTWDLYDQVMGSFGGKIERLMAIGGDGELAAKEVDSKSNRFKPVVKYFGPFTLDGGSNEHRFVMPQYIGSVKTMLVAGYESAYGKTDKATPVRKPLMVLATLPRVLGPEETLKLPITLFSGEKNIRDVKVEVKLSGPVSLPSGTSRSVTMSGIGDQTIDFDLSVKSETGFAKIEVTASSGNYKATDVIEIEVRNHNPPVTKVQEVILEAGKTWTASITPVGIAGTNSSILEVSSLPPVNLGQRLKYLMQYPYGCIEQTTSSVFPQLYLDQVKALSLEEKSMIQRNIKAGVERIKLFVNRDGGFAYWPGGEDSDSWGTTYAGHFLVESDAKGYYVEHDLIKHWKKYQKGKAQAWRKNQEHSSSELIQAYRLYTLALAGDPELGSMNRLREQVGLPSAASWMLASAYVKAGQPEAAKKLIANLSTTIKPYQEMAYSYGSDLRDKAIMLETLLLLNERTKGFELLKEISTALSNSSYWMSTQSVAWCLKSVGSFASTEQKGDLKFSYSYNGKEVSASTELPIAQVTLPMDVVKTGTLKVTSSSKGTLFVRIIGEGIPARGQEEDADNNLNVSVTYTNVDGMVIDPVQLEQGREFVASVTISNPGLRGIYKNLALNQIFPSGWEINNLRLGGDEDMLNGDKPTYQDIRDDRVFTYFDLGANQRKTFKIMLTASYAGTYYLPAVSCEAMYDHGIYARKKGMVVEVVKKVVQ
ncbi:MAG: MG2 domain-containing protein [Bacteroidota bacterium]